MGWNDDGIKDDKIKLKSTFGNSMKVDIEELKKEKKANFKERLDFIDRYVEWIKATQNKVLSKQHKDFIDSSFQKQ